MVCENVRTYRSALLQDLLLQGSNAGQQALQAPQVQLPCVREVASQPRQSCLVQLKHLVQRALRDIKGWQSCTAAVCCQRAARTRLRLQLGCRA